MALPTSNLFNRDDTLFGICEALSQDFGFNPLWLRLAFLPFLFVAPAQTIGAYFLLGLAVWASRTIFPTTVEAAPAPAEEATPATRDIPLAA